MKPLLLSLDSGVNTLTALVELTVGQHFQYELVYTDNLRTSWKIDCGRGRERILAMDYSKPGVIGIVLDGGPQASVNQMNSESLKEEYSTLELLRNLSNVVFGEEN